MGAAATAAPPSGNSHSRDHPRVHPHARSLCSCSLPVFSRLGVDRRCSAPNELCGCRARIGACLPRERASPLSVRTLTSARPVRRSHASLSAALVHKSRALSLSLFPSLLGSHPCVLAAHRYTETPTRFSPLLL